MTSNEDQNELLLRYLDGSLDPSDQAMVAALLRGDAGARAFLRGVAEQAVVVAAVERIDPHKPPPAKVAPPEFHLGTWQKSVRSSAPANTSLQTAK